MNNSQCNKSCSFEMAFKVFIKPAVIVVLVKYLVTLLVVGNGVSFVDALMMSGTGDSIPFLPVLITIAAAISLVELAELSAKRFVFHFKSLRARKAHA